MWNPDCAINEADAILAAKNGALKSMRIAKSGEDYNVFIHFTWRKEELFLSTTRSHKEPRKFRHIGRLIEFVEKNFPKLETLEVTLKPPTP